ncbi:MAG TPA: ABC transporter substrate-binding protein, partial [Negativicutes bacterium]
MHKRRVKSSFIVIIISCVMALIIAGCGSSQQASNSTTKDGSLAEVRIPDIYSPLYAYEPYIAEELGIFKEEGIKPVFTGVIPPGQHVAAVVAGTNDVGTLHVNRTIAGINAGAKIKAVVAGTESSKQYPHMTYIVLENSPIKTPQDLLGKKVGVVAIGGCHEYTPYEWLQKNGISDPKGKFTFVAVPAGNEEQA